MSTLAENKGKAHSSERKNIRNTYQLNYRSLWHLQFNPWHRWPTWCSQQFWCCRTHCVLAKMSTKSRALRSWSILNWVLNYLFTAGLCSSTPSIIRAVNSENEVICLENYTGSIKFPDTNFSREVLSSWITLSDDKLRSLPCYGGMLYITVITTKEAHRPFSLNWSIHDAVLKDFCCCSI